MIGLIAGAAALHSVGKFGRALISNTIQSYAGKELGSEIVSGAIKRFGFNLFPGVGAVSSLGRGLFGGLGEVKKELAAFKGLSDMAPARAKFLEQARDLSGILRGPTVPGTLSMRESASFAAQRVFTRGLKGGFSHSQSFSEQFSAGVKKSLSGMPVGDEIISKTMGHFDDSVKIAEQAFSAKRLHRATLVANTAVVAMPTLASSVGAYAVGRYTYGKINRRLRNRGEL